MMKQLFLKSILYKYLQQSLYLGSIIQYKVYHEMEAEDSATHLFKQISDLACTYLEAKSQKHHLPEESKHQLDAEEKIIKKILKALEVEDTHQNLIEYDISVKPRSKIDRFMPHQLEEERSLQSSSLHSLHSQNYFQRCFKDPMAAEMINSTDKYEEILLKKCELPIEKSSQQQIFYQQQSDRKKHEFHTQNRAQSEISNNNAQTILSEFYSYLEIQSRNRYQNRIRTRTKNSLPKQQPSHFQVKFQEDILQQINPQSACSHTYEHKFTKNRKNKEEDGDYSPEMQIKFEVIMEIAQKSNRDFRRKLRGSFQSLQQSVQKSARGRRPQFPNMEKKLIKWISTMFTSKVRLTQSDIRKKALAILKKCKEYKGNSFRASKGWMEKFFRRHLNIFELLSRQRTRKIVEIESDVISSSMQK